jgi:uncharacterized protein YkwD
MLVALLGSCVIQIPLEPGGADALPASINPTEFVQRTNEARMSNGLPPLRRNEALGRAAALHAGQMADAGVMAHELPNADLPTISSRVHAVGYEYAWVAENIAYGYPSVERVMNVWIGSETHRDNILDPNATEIGVGVAVTRSGTPYYSNLYARAR